MIDVVLVTEAACLHEDPSVRYNATALKEDGYLMRELTKQNLRCERVAWEDPSFDWTTTKIALLKTPWNYFIEINGFKTWMQKVSQQCMLINDCDMVLWNMDKHYLLDLQAEGIAIPETHGLDHINIFDPNAWNKRLGAKGMVVKPFISGGAKDTFLLKPPWDPNNVKAVSLAIQKQEMMVQPYIPSLVSKGELSLVFIDGKFTHAVIKRPKENDFRVQTYHGGTFEIHLPEKLEIDFGLRVLAACAALQHNVPLYARIDICYGDHGELLLMELEAIEPELWWAWSKPAVNGLVNALKKLL